MIVHMCNYWCLQLVYANHWFCHDSPLTTNGLLVGVAVNMKMTSFEALWFVVFSLLVFSSTYWLVNGHICFSYKNIINTTIVFSYVSRALKQKLVVATRIAKWVICSWTANDLLIHGASFNTITSCCKMYKRMYVKSIQKENLLIRIAFCMK